MPLEIHAIEGRTSILCVLLLGTLAAGGCGAPPHRETPPASATIEGKSQAWFQEHWGTPGARTKRLFGGETWVYFRTTGGTSFFPLSTMAPAECQIRLDFDTKGTLEDSGSSDC